MQTRKNTKKQKIALFKLTLTAFIIFFGNQAIDEMQAMTPEEFWGQFESHTIVIENARALTIEEVTKEATPEVEWEKGEFSAYTASVDETDADPTIAANNKPVFLGGIACPNRFALGQKIEVRALGVFECNDRMNIRYRESNHFDIYHETKDEAFQFGRQTLEWRAL